MLMLDSKKKKYEISSTGMDNLAEFAYLTGELINRYGIKNVKMAFVRGCNESTQENNRNGQI